jgi:hypothetical protein
VKSFYDAIVGLSCHKSSPQTLNLMRSANEIEGDILFFITTCIGEDIDLLTQGLGDIQKDVVICSSLRNSRYFSNDWSFVSCLNNGIQSSFWGTMDDDIVFVEGKDFVHKLYEADTAGFSVLGMSSSSHQYGGWGYPLEGHEGYRRLLYVDGHNMWTRFTDNVLYGLPDTIGSGNISFTEIEYCARMAYFTERPVIANSERVWMNHLFRGSPELNALRAETAKSDPTYGIQLFKEKYNIDVHPLDVTYDWVQAVKQIQSHPHRMKRHLVYDGLWNDWGDIYSHYRKEVQIVYP